MEPEPSAHGGNREGRERKNRRKERKGGEEGRREGKGGERSGVFQMVLGQLSGPVATLGRPGT